MLSLTFVLSAFDHYQYHIFCMTYKESTRLRFLQIDERMGVTTLRHSCLTTIRDFLISQSFSGSNYGNLNELSQRVIIQNKLGPDNHGVSSK